MKIINSILALEDGIIRNPVINEKFGDISKDNTGATIIGNLLNNVFNVMIIAGAVILIIMIIWSGIAIISGSGDKDRIQNAQKRLTYSIVGFVILICVFALANFVGGFLGLSFFKTLELPFPTP
ncbi:pilin [Patescibacteria group bacterium]|nr:pilin [Patescibacteria group bacterium]